MKKIVRYLIMICACVFSFFVFTKSNVSANSFTLYLNKKSSIKYSENEYYYVENDYKSFITFYSVSSDKYSFISIRDNNMYTSSTCTYKKTPANGTLTCQNTINVNNGNKDTNVSTTTIAIYEDRVIFNEMVYYPKTFYTSSDNQQAINDYIQENNYHSNEEYLQYGETKKQEGIDSVDITKDNQQAINDYIQENNYHSNEEYLQYGETKKQEGIDSVDITSDNAAAINNYIEENNYHSNEEYLNYGSAKYNEGYNSAKNYVNLIYENNYSNSGLACLNNDIECILDNTYNEGINSVDITSDNEQAINDYIQENNYHTNEEYLNYGTTKKNEGYNQASEEGKQLGNFVPSLLGGIGSFFLTILNFNVLGFNLLSIIGIIIAVAGIIVVIKFLKG